MRGDDSRRDYLWAPATEAVKVPAMRVACGDAPEERKAAYNDFMREFRAFPEREGRMPDNSPTQDGELQWLQVSRLGCRDAELPAAACVYVGPPYRGTGCKGYCGAFDFDAFGEWLGDVPFMAVVSECTPAGVCGGGPPREGLDDERQLQGPARGQAAVRVEALHGRVSAAHGLA